MIRARSLAMIWSIGVLLAAPLPSLASSFDERGRLVLTSPWRHALDEPGGVTLSGRGADRSDFVEDERGLEGRGALIVGSVEQRAIIALDPRSVERMRGRRIDVRAWVRPEGLELDGFLAYDHRAPVPLFRTGRVTSDGWYELASGPIDAWFGDLAPFAVILAPGAGYDWSGSPDGLFASMRTKRALADALEIVDLGPRAVPNASCSLPTEEEACGAHGSCFAGRCVDAQAIVPAPPPGPIRDEYVERRLAELEIFSGVRRTRPELAAVRAELMGALDEPARPFWAAFSRAHERLIDGHGAPPSTLSVLDRDLSGICLGPGVADRLPSPSAAMLPMVFRLQDNSPWAEVLRPGDVLTHVDGVPVWEWVDRAAPYFYYNGDERGRRALSTRDIMGAAQRTGARATFARCSIEERACEPAEVEAIEIDASELLGPLVAGERPPRYGAIGSAPPCTLRFEQIAPEPADPLAWRHMAEAVDRDGARELVINGVPGDEMGTMEGRAWTRAVRAAFVDAPARVLLDQRHGEGGTFSGVGALAGELMGDQDYVTVVGLPWTYGPLQEWEIAAIARCEPGGFFEDCGSSHVFRAHDLPEADRHARSARVAIVNGWDLSGNDFLSRLLGARRAPTRFFGYAPTIGAYGYACSFPSHIGERAPMRYQCSDSLFYEAPDVLPRAPEFESARGWAPDETIYQSQADAIAGRDTLLEAARAWLAESLTIEAL